jgi:hypothetical protein
LRRLRLRRTREAAHPYPLLAALFALAPAHGATAPAHSAEPAGENSVQGQRSAAIPAHSEPPAAHDAPSPVQRTKPAAPPAQAAGHESQSCPHNRPADGSECTSLGGLLNRFPAAESADERRTAKAFWLRPCRTGVHS